MWPSKMNAHEHTKDAQETFFRRKRSTCIGWGKGCETKQKRQLILNSNADADEKVFNANNFAHEKFKTIMND